MIQLEYFSFLFFSFFSTEQLGLFNNLKLQKFVSILKHKIYEPHIVLTFPHTYENINTIIE